MRNIPLPPPFRHSFPKNSKHELVLQERPIFLKILPPKPYPNESLLWKEKMGKSPHPPDPIETISPFSTKQPR